MTKQMAAGLLTLACCFAAIAYDSMDFGRGMAAFEGVAKPRTETHYGPGF